LITALIVVIVVVLVLGMVGLATSVRVLREYERGVMFRLGRLMDQRGPGLIMMIPSIDRMVRISLRTVTLTIPAQEVITRDNIPARVTAVAYYRVIDANRAVTEVESFRNATLQVAQTTLRSVLGGADPEPWGIKVTAVEIKDVEIPERMQHAIARQAEAERERRAKVINAEGEFQAAAKLAQAADVISENPVTIQLRYLQTLREIGGSQNSTIVFPMPMDVIGPALAALGQAAAPAKAQAPADAEPERLSGGPNGAALDPAAARELAAGASGGALDELTEAPAPVAADADADDGITPVSP
jgi:regulator of protease activity HflC (stomatin/prohibitin superfamily)